MLLLTMLPANIENLSNNRYDRGFNRNKPKMMTLSSNHSRHNRRRESETGVAGGIVLRTGNGHRIVSLNPNGAFSIVSVFFLGSRIEYRSPFSNSQRF